jgi:hypothetical protein
MFNKQTEPSELQPVIDIILERMKYVDPESEEFAGLVARLDKLHAMKTSEKNNRRTVSPDAILTAGASILGILLIIGYERVNVITTKALGFVSKPKL